MAKCDYCAWRKKSEANPKTFLAWLWRIHTKICPEWKAYQRLVAAEKAAEAGGGEGKDAKSS